MTQNEIQCITNDMKENVHIPINKPFPIVPFWEALVAFGDYEMEILQDEEMKTNYAETFPDKKLLRVRESTYDKACNGELDSLFTIAHEYGHLTLHTSNRVVYAKTIDTIPLYADPEWQADIFAKELLCIKNIKNINNEQLVSKQITQIPNHYRK